MKRRRLVRKKPKKDKEKLFHISFYLNPKKHPDAEVIEKLKNMRYGKKRASDIARIAFFSTIMGFGTLPLEKKEKKDEE